MIAAHRSAIVRTPPAIASGRSGYFHVEMHKHKNTRLALLFAPLAFVLLSTGCDTKLSEELECTIDSSYRIKCVPKQPSDPYTALAVQ
jgi:hypothetical protein